MDKRPARKQNRIKDYDYSQCGAYFVTVCAKGRKNVFGTIPPYIGGGPVFATVQLSECGIIAQNELKNIPNHYENVDVDCFVVMPNHIHAIIVINAPEPTAYIPPQTNAGTAPPIVGARFIAPAVTVATTPAAPTVGQIVRAYKARVARKSGAHFWQRNFHDHVIRSAKDYAHIAEYIENNPAKWQNDRYYVF